MVALNIRKIKLLPEEVIQKIAAGEVVENCASIIKELIENAIDAEASFITITTYNGGKGELTVSDNGCGMSEEDLHLSILRHATSKIGSEADLFNLSTLGFRGEALAAIASVSKMTMISTLRGESAGTRLEIEGGKIIKVLPSSRREGTSITVSSLFYNTPARRAFQKSENVEIAAIRKTLIAAALSYLNCGFEWIDQEKTLFSIPQKALLKERVGLLLGEEFNTACALSFEKETTPPFSLQGLICKSTQHLPNRKGQHLFINRRPVQASLITEAVEEAFRFRLPEKRFPLFVLHLTLPANAIDANVHPQKREVRLSGESELFDFVKEAIQMTLDHRTEPFFTPTAFAPASHFIPIPSFTEPKVSESVEESSLDLTFTMRFLLAVGDLILFEKEGSLFLVHSKRALERLFFEKMKEESAVTFSQKLLFPVIFEVGQEQIAHLEENSELLIRSGIVLQRIGKRTFSMEATLPGFEEKEKILSLISNLRINEEEKRVRMARALAKNSTLSFSTKESAIELLRALFSLKTQDVTPSGLPISQLLTEENLLKTL